MQAIRTNTKIEQSGFINGVFKVVPAIQNGYMAAPGVFYDIDFNTFKKTKEEKDLLLTLKIRNKEDRQLEYGKKANKFLNTTANRVGLEKPLHFTF
jgi:hypothetical protein